MEELQKRINGFSLKTIECYVEKLYHFKCVACQKWWSIADGKFNLKDTIFCPHCGQIHIIDNFRIGEEELEEREVNQSILDEEPIQLELF